MIRVRAATDDDARALADVGQRAFRAAYGGTASDDDIRTHVEGYFSEPPIRQELARAENRYLIAEESGRPAGFVKIRDGDVPECVDVESALEIQQLYVAPDFQRRGVGGMLVDEAVAWTAKRGRDGVWLSVWTEADWATAFYLNYGFRQCGTADFQLGSSVYLDYVMLLPLERA